MKSLPNYFNMPLGFLMMAIMLAPANSQTKGFDPSSWKTHQAFSVSDTASIARQHVPVDVSFSLSGNLKDSNSLRLIFDGKGKLMEIPSQFYHLKQKGEALKGKVAFFLRFKPRRNFELSNLCRKCQSKVTKVSNPIENNKSAGASRGERSHALAY